MLPFSNDQASLAEDLKEKIDRVINDMFDERDGLEFGSVVLEAARTLSLEAGLRHHAPIAAAIGRYPASLSSAADGLAAYREHSTESVLTPKAVRSYDFGELSRMVASLSVEELRALRRDLARSMHPDVAAHNHRDGAARTMARVNQIIDAAILTSRGRGRK